MVSLSSYKIPISLPTRNLLCYDLFRIEFSVSKEMSSSFKGEYFMKTILLKLLIAISWIYSLGYILFGLPNDTFLMRAITGVMSAVFSCSLWFFH